MQLDDIVRRLPSAEPLFFARSLNHGLVLSFFLTFARAEHALKAAGFVHGRQGDHAPVVEWPRFAGNHLQATLAPSDPEVAAAIDYLAHHPPDRQVVTGKRVVFQPCTSPTPKDAKSLVASVTTVRNNLFHGGKDISRGLVERDEKLLRSCLVLLAFLVQLDPAVANAFEQVGPAHMAA